MTKYSSGAIRSLAMFLQRAHIKSLRLLEVHTDYASETGLASTSLLIIHELRKLDVNTAVKLPIRKAIPKVRLMNMPLTLNSDTKKQFHNCEINDRSVVVFYIFRVLVTTDNKPGLVVQYLRAACVHDAVEKTVPGILAPLGP